MQAPPSDFTLCSELKPPAVRREVVFLMYKSLAERGAGESRFYVSDSVEGFSRLASTFLQRDVQEAVTQVDIWAYPSEPPALANQPDLG